MKLYMAVSAENARQILDDGFVGVRTRIMNDDGTEGVYDFVMLRDRPPTGLFLDDTVEIATHVAEDGTVRRQVSDGTSVTDDSTDMTMVIEIPHEVIKEFAISEDPPAGWPFREYWLPADVVNAFRLTLTVIDTEAADNSSPT